MKTYLITQIAYDFGSEHRGFDKPDVPTKLVIEAPQEITASPIELEDYLANAISDRTGFCVEHFTFKKQK
jgi:hypothetical protein